MPLLAIETSCDETSAAVIDQGRVLSNVISSQVSLHAEYGGVVPELATREHLRNIGEMVRRALKESGLPMSGLKAIAATQGPGLPSALWVGFLTGQAIAYARGLPFFGVHHHEAHLYSPWIQGDPPRADFDSFEPCISLIVSGGHTLLVHVRAELDHVVLGSTVDDAAGECFDKTAKLIGLPYPGGPELDRLAQGGNPKAFPFPRPMMNDPGFDFSFSGLKTAVRYFVRDHPELVDEREKVQDLCASVQAAIVEVLVTKTVRAAQKFRLRCITASGGVTANRALRAALAERCKQEGIRLLLTERSFCTDNAAMIGVLAERRMQNGDPTTGLEAEVKPSWELS